MKTQGILGALITVAMILFSASVEAQVTDDFDNGIIAPMWHVMNRTNGISVSEESGYLKMLIHLCRG